MAITHNFKEGIDWAADPTGETPLAGFTFVSKDGNDSTGDGSPQTPYLTIQKSFDVNSSAKVIVGSGLWQDSVSGMTPDAQIIGDGYVIAQGDGSNTWIDGRCEVYNVVQINWGNIASGRGHKIFNCIVINSNWDAGGSTAGGTSIGNILINCSCEQTWTGTMILNDFILINTTFTSGSNVSLNFFNSFFDEDSVISNGRVGQGTLDYCAINGARSGFDTETNILENVNPAFNNKSGFDLSVNGASELVGAGLNGANIGKVVLGKGYFQGVSELDTGLDANVNIAYNSLGEIELQAGGGDSQTFETEEEEALELSVMGAINLSGFPDLINNTPDNDNTLTNPNQLILEINVALLDGNYTGWKKYRWNEQPTQNADGTSNGESSYNWADNNKVPYKKRKFRITVRNDYNQA